MENKTVRRYYSFNVCTEMKMPNISDKRQSKYYNFCGLSPIVFWKSGYCFKTN